MQKELETYDDWEMTVTSNLTSSLLISSALEKLGSASTGLLLPEKRNPKTALRGTGIDGWRRTGNTLAIRLKALQ